MDWDAIVGGFWIFQDFDCGRFLHMQVLEGSEYA